MEGWTSDLHTKDCQWRGSSFCSTKGHDRPPRKRFSFSEKFWTGGQPSAVNLGWSNVSHMLHGTGIFTCILAEIYGKCSIHGEIWGIVSASYNSCLVGDFFGNSVNYVLVIFKTFTKNVEKNTCFNRQLFPILKLKGNQTCPRPFYLVMVLVVVAPSFGLRDGYIHLLAT